MRNQETAVNNDTPCLFINNSDDFIALYIVLFSRMLFRKKIEGTRRRWYDGIIVTMVTVQLDHCNIEGIYSIQKISANETVFGLRFSNG